MERLAATITPDERTDARPVGHRGWRPFRRQPTSAAGLCRAAPTRRHEVGPRNPRPDLQPTALVYEAYLRLVTRGCVSAPRTAAPRATSAWTGRSNPVSPPGSSDP